MVPLKPGEEIPIGAMVRTGDTEVKITCGNSREIILAPHTEVVFFGLDEKKTACSLKINKGTVSAKTKDLPDGVSLIIETPVGSCSVDDNASFSVTYQKMSDMITEKMTISSSEGNVTLSGKYLGTGADSVRAGGELSFSLVDSPQRKCVYFPEITVKGQDINLAMGGKNMVTLSAGSVVEGAMDYGYPDAPFSAVSVKEGSLTAGGLDISAGMAPLFIRGDSVVMGNEKQLATDPFTHPKTPNDLITAHDGDSLIIADTEFNTDLILYGDKVVAGDWLRDNAEFFVKEFHMMPTEGVKELIVGAGPQQLITVPEEVFTFLAAEGITVAVMPTDQAIRSYNQAVKDGKGGTTAAVIILEDYMNAEEYLGHAREAAASLISGTPGPTGPLPPPEFVAPTSTPLPEPQPLPPIPNPPDIPDTPQSP
ncbi:MAG: Mth938-like domain-containing protein [Lentisphaeria bacterium]|nr:Mth938-like domain-containing protein [Lentisphaeria bacterium]